MIAYCYRSGQIEFGAKCPKGALPILKGRAKKVRDVVEASCRWAYDNKTMLVPGIPEAQSDDEALDALHHFCEFVRK